MNEIPLHATPIGRRFYEQTLPELVTELGRINATLAELIEVIAKATAAKSEGKP